MRRAAAWLLPALMAAAVIAEDGAVDPSAYSGDPVLTQYLDEAARAHPALRSLHAMWLAQMERIPQATALDDPMFTFGQFIRSDSARFRLAIGQQFPWFGVRRLRGEREAIVADALLAEMAAQRNRLIADVKQAYYEYAYLAAEQAVFRSQLDILEQVVEAITTQFGLGYAREDAMLRAQIEKTRLLDRIRGLDQSRPALSARLAERIGRPVQDVLPFPEPLPVPSEIPDERAVLDIIAAQSPELAAAHYRVEAGRTAVALAEKERYPTVAVELEYVSMKEPESERWLPSPGSLAAAGQLSDMLSGKIPVDRNMLAMDLYELSMFEGPESRDSEDELAISLTVNVPLWRKRIRAGIREAAMMQDAAEADRAALSLQLQRMAAGTLFEFHDAVRRIGLYENDLIPQAERVYESILVGYSVGIDADVLDLLGSVNQLLDFQIEQYGAHRDALVAIAELEYLMGRPLGAVISGHASAADGSPLQIVEAADQP